MIILSSPSGVGKTTLTKKIQQKYPNFKISVSHTTRKPRSNEVNGVDYNFVYHEIFEKLIKYIWHPIPTWTHIKCISFVFKLSCSTSNSVIFFKNLNLVSLFRQICSSTQASKSTSYDSMFHLNLFLHKGINSIIYTQQWKIVS